MATRVPEMFSITESALNMIRSLVPHPGYVAYICWSTTLSNPPSEGWDVVSFEEPECADPAEFSGIRFLFDPQRAAN